MLKDFVDSVRYFRQRRSPLSKKEKGEIEQLFVRIDYETEKAVTLLSRRGYFKDDVELVLLGYLNLGKPPAGKRKRINGGANPIVLVDQTEPVTIENGVMLPTENNTTLPIIENGMMRFFMLDCKNTPDTSGFLTCLHSTMNEFSLYKALLETCKDQMKATISPEDRKNPKKQSDNLMDEATVRSLGDALEKLDARIKETISFYPKEDLALWDQGVEIRIQLYKRLFEKRKLENIVAPPENRSRRPYAEVVTVVRDKSNERG